MIEELGKLAEEGRLKNFTDLANAVLRIEKSAERVTDQTALGRVARLLDTIFTQAYRGERSMEFLADRVDSLTEILDLMAMDEPGAPEAESPSEAEPDTVRQEPQGASR